MFQQAHYTPVFNPHSGDPGVGIPDVEQGLIGGFVKGLASTFTGGLIGEGGAEGGPVDRQGSATGNTQAGPQINQSAAPNFFDYASQQSPALGLLNEGVNSFSQGYDQGAANGGGIGGGLMGGLSQMGSDLSDKGQSYAKKLQGLWGN